MTLHKSTTSFYFGLLSTGFISLAVANENDAIAQIERIEVTTNKRLLTTFDISGSVAVLSQEEIDAMGIDDLQSAALQLSGVSLTQPVRNRSTITIRGINTDIGETQLTQDPVGLYINDMPVTGTYAEILQPDISLYDVNRIEVAKGPQGTLYGSGNIGGAVRIISNAPELDQFVASAQLDVGDTSKGGTRQRFDGMFNAPLKKDELALRVVASYRDEEGWVENIRLGGANDYEEQQVRAALTWLPSNELQLDFTALYIDSDPFDGDSFDPELGEFERSTAIRDSRPFELEIYNAVIDYEIADFANFVSSSNYRQSDAEWLTNIGPFGDLGDFVNQSSIESEGFAQEFRLVSNTESNLQWLAGVYYYHNQSTGPLSFNVLGLGEFVNFVTSSTNGSDLFFGGALDYEMKEYASFADITYRFSPEWQTSVGLRYFSTDAVYSQFQQRAFDFDVFGLVDAPDFTNEVDDDGLMWRASTTFTPSPNQRFYASLSKGIRAAQTNPNLGPSFADPDDVMIPPGYQSDTLYAAELGAHFSFNQDRTFAKMAVFYNDWRDIQIDALRLSDNSNYIANAGDAFSRGIEVEWRSLLSDAIQAYVALTWQDSEIQSITNEQSLLSGAVEGDALPGTAEVLLNAGMSYQWTAFGHYTMQARADISHVGDSVNRFSNLNGTSIANPDFAENEAYTYVHANLALLLSNTTVTLYVENLFDDDSVILNIGQSQPNPAISLRPRTLGVRVNHRF